MLGQEAAEQQEGSNRLPKGRREGHREAVEEDTVMGRESRSHE